ncbi:MAG: hypothetical protein NE334_04670 [Lentisphaeraceae bacterium]|nr:hypothetical protein [Lentisphaeraceae bacterium]
MRLLNLITLAFLLFSCSSNIDPNLLAQIENRNDITEELFENYEEINDELIDLIEEKNYFYGKLTKTKNELREVNAKIISRKKRISSMENPEAKEGEEVQAAPEKLIAPHREKLAGFEEEKVELEAEAELFLKNTREFTTKSLEVRKKRNAIYDQYTQSRLALKALHDQAAAEKPQD